MLKQLFEIWSLDTSFNLIPDGASPELIAKGEESFGRPFPQIIKELYANSNGLKLFDSNLVFMPISWNDDDSTEPKYLPQFGDDLRKWGWKVPKDLFIFANDEGGNSIGIWYPENAKPTDVLPIVIVGETESLKIVGTDMQKFLFSETAAQYNMQRDFGESILGFEMLDLPQEIIDMNIDDDETFIAIHKWADPQLPDYDTSPFNNSISEQDIKDWVTSIKG